MLGVKNITVELSDASGQMTTMAEQIEKNVSRQQSETLQVATAITEMATTIQEVSQNANETSLAADGATSQSQQGQDRVNETVDAISRLVEETEDVSEVIKKLAAESEKIGGVLEVIQGISEQTNLLALNASIESARAGEQGRGFAVVADEVRILAGRTQGATLQIKEMIDQLQFH